MRDKNPPKRHQGADFSAPYPVSRLAPAMELVDLARTISKADDTIREHTTGKLKIIAQQIMALQNEAKAILQKAQEDQELHRADCHFKRIAGNTYNTYYLYRTDSGKNYFSLLSPEDWNHKPPHSYTGAYRLENDMSWTALDDTNSNEINDPVLQNLLEQV